MLCALSQQPVVPRWEREKMATRQLYIEPTKLWREACMQTDRCGSWQVSEVICDLALLLSICRQHAESLSLTHHTSSTLHRLHLTTLIISVLSFAIPCPAGAFISRPTYRITAICFLYDSRLQSVGLSWAAGDAAGRKSSRPKPCPLPLRAPLGAGLDFVTNRLRVDPPPHFTIIIQGCIFLIIVPQNRLASPDPQLGAAVSIRAVGLFQHVATLLK